MTSAVQPLRVCLRACRRVPAPQRKFAARPRLPIPIARRAFSSTPAQWRRAAEEDEGGEETEERALTKQELEAMEVLEGFWDKLPPADRHSMERTLNNVEAEAREAVAPPKVLMKKRFWNDEESDSDLITDEQNEDMFDEDDIMSMAHGKFEEFREYREYARIAAWEMPLLSKLARPFVPPTAEEPLRFRYTSYMGEFHPAENKVVVEFCPKDLPLDEAQQLKMKKLLGPRYNPETDIAKMSCEQFEHQAQNKRYLGDVINSLIEKAKDPTDMFEDIPLDTRHHTFKTKPKFPTEWRMTEERRRVIEEARQKSLLLDKAKEEQGALVDGPARIQQFLEQPAAFGEPQYATQQLRGPAARGRF
ncbi:hypothetical protein DL770_003168 [Monosporascus sp. CRB-9-2]|nr:hypothetical protein DL770_003168 [Monosporascus sp. CRB-9-2]